MQYLLRKLRGYLYIEIQGSSPERFINMCVHHNIKIWELKSKEQTFLMFILVSDFKKLRPFIRKTNIKIKILERYGLPFIFQKYKKRYFFKWGFFAALISLYLYTFIIWNIQITGNTRYSEDEIINFLNSQQIYKTMPVSKVNTDEIISLIRGNFPEIIWVSTHVEGSNLVIRVKENEQIKDLENNPSNITVTTNESNDLNEKVGMDLIAQEDGIISSIITSSGIPQVHQGDEVKKGDILILGRIDVLNDNKEVESYNYTKAEGEVIIAKSYQYEDTLELEYQEKEYIGNEVLKEYYWFGDYLIAPSKGLNIESDLFEVSNKEYSIHPTQQSKYKLIFGVKTYREYQWIDKIYTETEIQNILSKKFSIFKEDLEQKGVEIIENNVKIDISDKVARAKGSLDLEIKNTLLKETIILPNPQIIEEDSI